MPISNNERISPSELRRLLIYDRETGHLIWKLRNVNSHADKVFNGRYAGKIAGCISDGEVVVNIRINGKQIGFRAHRIAWAIEIGAWPENDVDHENGNPHDNRWVNLREASVAENNSNRNVVQGKCKFKGVSHYDHKFSASITKSGKQHWLGVFEDEREAALAYDRAAKTLHGEFAKTNSALGLL